MFHSLHLFPPTWYTLAVIRVRSQSINASAFNTKPRYQIYKTKFAVCLASHPPPNAKLDVTVPSRIIYHENISPFLIFLWFLHRLTFFIKRQHLKLCRLLFFTMHINWILRWSTAFNLSNLCMSYIDFFFVQGINGYFFFTFNTPKVI